MLVMPHMKAPSALEEEGLFASPYKYIAASFVTTSLAVVVLSVSFPISCALFATAGWLAVSGIVILANRAAEGTCLEKIVHQFHATAMEINATIAAIILFPLTFFTCYHNPKENLQGRPILLVNGYLSFGSTWHYLKNKLNAENLGPVFTMNVGSGDSIPTYAQKVQDRVKEIQSKTKRNDLVLIGHSKGGLVSSYFATHLADEIQCEVTDVITIGTPFKGAPKASRALGKDAKQMRPESTFHQDLRLEMARNQQIRFFYIGSENDGLVPQSSALIADHAQQQLLFKDMGHLSLIFSSRVAKQISSWLV